MKKILLIGLTFILSSLIIIACGNKKRDANEAVDFLKNLNSYSTDVNIEIKNDRQKLNYNAKQIYAKDKGYRMELANDRIFIYTCDNKIYVNDKNNGVRYTQNKDFDEIYKLSFIGEYIGLLYTNEETKYSFKNIGGEDYQLIHLKIPGSNRNIDVGIMYVNLKDNLPKLLKIYDTKGKERIVINYNSFKSDVHIDDSWFDVK